MNIEFVNCFIEYPKNYQDIRVCKIVGQVYLQEERRERIRLEEIRRREIEEERRERLELEEIVDLEEEEDEVDWDSVNIDE